MGNREMPKRAQKQAEKWHKTTLDTADPPMSHANVQHVAGVVLGATELTILSECTEARAEASQEMATEKNVEQFMTCTKMLRKLRRQNRSLTW